MSFEWGPHISKVHSYLIWVPLFLLSLTWIPIVANLYPLPTGLLLIVLSLVVLTGTSAAFVFFTWNERAHPRRIRAWGFLTPEHIRLYLDGVSARMGAPVRTRIERDHIEIYHLIGLIGTGFEYDPAKSIIVTQREDNIARNALDSVDDAIRARSVEGSRFDEASIASLKEHICALNERRGAVTEDGGNGWRLNIYQVWMYVVIGLWFLFGISAFGGASIWLSMVIGTDPRYIMIGIGVLILLVSYPVIKFFAGRDERKGTFRSPERYKVTGRGVLYKDKISDVVGHFFWSEIERFSVSPLVKVVRIVPRKGYRPGSFYSHVDGPMGWRINEYRFIFKRKDLIAFREMYDLFGPKEDP